MLGDDWWVQSVHLMDVETYCIWWIERFILLQHHIHLVNNTFILLQHPVTSFSDWVSSHMSRWEVDSYDDLHVTPLYLSAYVSLPCLCPLPRYQGSPHSSLADLSLLPSYAGSLHWPAQYSCQAFAAHRDLDINSTLVFNNIGHVIFLTHKD